MRRKSIRAKTQTPLRERERERERERGGERGESCEMGGWGMKKHRDSVITIIGAGANRSFRHYTD